MTSDSSNLFSNKTTVSWTPWRVDVDDNGVKARSMYVCSDGLECSKRGQLQQSSV